MKYHPGAATQISNIQNVTLAVANDAVLARSEAGCAVAFDGFLFNRTALLSRLETPQSTDKNDAHLIALAYHRWGERFSVELDGEFSFVLWDGSAGKLLLGRDVVGKGSLFYANSNGDVAFSSEIQGLFSFPGIVPQADNESLVRFMAVRPEVGRTVFRNVRYLPPAHTFVVEKGKPDRLIKVWHPEDQPLLKLRDPREYAEALHSTLLRAVEVRVPVDGIIATQLSAGYDSSGVTALLAQVLARQNRPLLAYTSVPSHPSDASAIVQGWFSDEWPLAHQVAEMYPNIEHIPIKSGSAPWMPALDALSHTYSGPAFFIRNAAWICELQRSAQARGAAVMFNGQMGNLTASYDGGFSLFDLRRRHDWVGLARAIHRRRRQGAGWRGLLVRTWMPPGATHAAIRRVLRKKPRPFYEHSLIRPEFYRSTNYPELRASPLGSPVEGDRRNSAAWRLSIMRIIDFGGVGAGERRLFGSRRADPTSDRRLIELCLSIPDEVYAGEKPRDLYREAMRTSLPPELLQQTGSGLQSSDFLENFGARIGEFQQEMRLLHDSPAARQVLDLQRMQELLDAWPARGKDNRARLDQRYNYTFGGAISMGRFLRRLEQGEMFPR